MHTHRLAVRLLWLWLMRDDDVHALLLRIVSIFFFFFFSFDDFVVVVVVAAAQVCSTLLRLQVVYTSTKPYQFMAKNGNLFRIKLLFVVAAPPYMHSTQNTNEQNTPNNFDNKIVFFFEYFYYFAWCHFVIRTAHIHWTSSNPWCDVELSEMIGCFIQSANRSMRLTATAMPIRKYDDDEIADRWSCWWGCDLFFPSLSFPLIHSISSKNIFRVFFFFSFVVSCVLSVLSLLFRLLYYVNLLVLSHKNSHNLSI